jgi:hypothetical protein
MLGGRNKGRQCARIHAVMAGGEGREGVEELRRLIEEEENMLRHLLRSNAEMLAFDPRLEDADLRAAVAENEGVVTRKQARLAELRRLLAEAVPHAAEPDAKHEEKRRDAEEEEEEAPNGLDL